LGKIGKDVSQLLRFCFGCGAKMLVQNNNGNIQPVVIMDSDFLHGKLIDERSMECPSCHSLLRTFAEHEGKLFAVCLKCDRLVLTPSEESSEKINSTTDASLAT
jgi:hypothetical protein